MLAFLRRTATSKGFLGGSKVWMAVGALVWGIRAAQWAMRREERVLFHEQLAPGERLLITHSSGPEPRRSRRR